MAPYFDAEYIDPDQIVKSNKFIMSGQQLLPIFFRFVYLKFFGLKILLLFYRFYLKVFPSLQKLKSSDYPLPLETIVHGDEPLVNSRKSSRTTMLQWLNLMWFKGIAFKFYKISETEGRFLWDDAPSRRWTFRRAEEWVGSPSGQGLHWHEGIRLVLKDWILTYVETSVFFLKINRVHKLIDFIIN